MTDTKVRTPSEQPDQTTTQTEQVRAARELIRELRNAGLMDQQGARMLKYPNRRQMPDVRSLQGLSPFANFSKH